MQIQTRKKKHQARSCYLAIPIHFLLTKILSQKRYGQL